MIRLRGRSSVTVHISTLKLLILWGVTSTAIALYCFWSEGPISPLYLMLISIAFPLVVATSFIMYKASLREEASSEQDKSP